MLDRFLARIVAVLGDAATLKGGLVLELRLERARTTKDIDLRLMGSPDDILGKLQDAGRRNHGDFMTFEVGPDDDQPEIQNDGIPPHGHGADDEHHQPAFWGIFTQRGGSRVDFCREPGFGLWGSMELRGAGFGLWGALGGPGDCPSWYKPSA